MKAIIHIGTETAQAWRVQEFLSLNHALLAEAGYLVPQSLGPDHRLLSLLFKSGDFSDDYTRRHGLNDAARRKEAKAEWDAAFRSEVAQANPHTVLISSDLLHSRLRKVNEIAAFWDFLTDIFDEVRIIVYLHNPADLAIATYSNAMTTGRGENEFPLPSSPLAKAGCDHLTMVSRWIGVFGATAIVPRLFDSDEMYRGSIIEDYCHTAGLPELDYAQPEAPQPPLTYFGQAVLRQFLAGLPSTLPKGQFGAARREAQGFFLRHFRSPAALALPAPMQAAYDATFAASNEWVRRHYFPHRYRLFPEPQPFGQMPSEVDPEAAAATATALVELWLGTRSLPQPRRRQSAVSP